MDAHTKVAISSVQILAATCEDELKERVSSMDLSFVFDCGYSKPTSSITMDSRPEFIRSITLHYTLYKNYAELMQFKEGLLETLSFENLIQSHPVEMSILAVDNDES